MLHKTYSDGDILICKSLKPTRISLESVKVSIKRPEKSSPNIFSQKDWIFNVLTLPIGWNVQRKINDFEWLQEILVQEFPGYYIPNIPKVKKLEDPNLLNLKIKQFVLFINYLVSFDIYKRSPSLVYFLEEEDRNNFSKFKKIKYKRTGEVKDMTTSDGKINCEYENLQDFTNKTSSFLDSYKEIMKKLVKESTNMNRLISDLSTSIINYSSIISEIANISFHIPVYGRSIKEMYNKVADTLVKINEKIYSCTVNINDYLHGTFKYFLHQGEQLQELYKEKDLMFVEVDKIKKNINKIVAQDKGVSKDITDKFKKLKEKAGVLNYLCRDQTERFFQHFARTLFQEFSEFFNKCSGNITGILTNLAMLEDGLELSKTLL